jgi:polysaccharide biosynthesis protein PelD
MERRPPWKIALELLLVAVLIGAANVLAGADAGFLSSVANPYVLLALVAAAAYGKYWGFAVTAMSAAVAAFPVPLVAGLLGRRLALPEDPASLLRLAALPVGIALTGSYVLGVIRDAHYTRAERMRERAKSESRDVALLEREVDAFQSINAELEERVSRQQDSLTYLYSRIQSLYSLNIDRGIGTILETVASFSGATSCSIWEHRLAAKTLELRGSRGWAGDEARETSLPVEGTIEGWVVRNNLVFSLRMLLSYDNLQNMDKGRSIITIPIPAGRQIWGVLNIEAMPFEKYNQYTEKLLQVLVALCAPAIERALEYASAVSAADVNEVTGLPSFSTFYSVLERSVQRARLEKTGICVIVFEIANYASLLESFTDRDVLAIYPTIAAAMVALSHNQATVYHYREDSQLAVLYPHLDTDGAVLFGLELMERIHSHPLMVGNQTTPLEIILGYAVLDSERQKPDDLLRAAESLLEMQKL